MYGLLRDCKGSLVERQVCADVGGYVLERLHKGWIRLLIKDG